MENTEKTIPSDIQTKKISRPEGRFESYNWKDHQGTNTTTMATMVTKPGSRHFIVRSSLNGKS